MAEPLKNAIGEQTILGLSQRIGEVYVGFDGAGFVGAINPKLPDLTLTERLDLVTDTLGQYLPDDFRQAANILTQSLGEELDAEGDDPTAKDYASSRGFIVVALGNYIAKHGLDHFEPSMTALYEMTKRFSSEGPIRDFLIHAEAQTLARFEQWAKDDNVHVRRLVSESTRPRLPWARQLPRFIDDPRPILPLLETLKDDSRLYVRRSVANNLNDIAKDHPDLVVDTLASWQEDDNPHMAWLTKHALRTLLKDGHRGALALLGFSDAVDLAVETFSVSPAILPLGDSLTLDVTLSTQASRPQKLMIDYVIYHMKANGKLSPKVFKWTQQQIAADSPLTLQKQHSIKPISTRKYYAGRHEAHLQINGRIYAEAAFELAL